MSSRDGPRLNGPGSFTTKKMGYTYVAVGGMVPLRTPQIKTALRAIRELIEMISKYILGFAKADQINELKIIISKF